MDKTIFDGEVGLFFIISGNLYSWGEPISDIKTINAFKSTDLSHFDYFNDLISLFPCLKQYKDYDYGYFKRGRVVYNTKNKLFIIYIDQCLKNDSKTKAKIISEFNLKNYKYEFKLDEHYRCANCDQEIKNNNAILHHNQNIKH